MVWDALHGITGSESCRTHLRTQWYPVASTGRKHAGSQLQQGSDTLAGEETQAQSGSHSAGMGRRPVTLKSSSSPLGGTYCWCGLVRGGGRELC
jgi:hypothetical protein